MNKKGNFNLIAFVIGVFISFFLLVISTPITSFLYDNIGISEPICDDLKDSKLTYCQAKEGLFNISFFVLPIIAVIGLCISLGFFMKNVESSGMKEKCFYCNKKLKEDYKEDKSKWRDKGKEDEWSHSFCIPEKEKDLWNDIQ